MPQMAQRPRMNEIDARCLDAARPSATRGEADEAAALRILTLS
jgi:hypothetical protein